MIEELHFLHVRVANNVAKNYCISHLYYRLGTSDNLHYICDIIEDQDRGLDQSMSEAQIKELKVKKMTAIPTGTYKLAMVYSKKYGKKMPSLRDVVGYVGILIHPGNTSKDTDGCLLLGLNKIVGQVVQSKVTFEKFLSSFRPYIENGLADIQITRKFKVDVRTSNK